MSGRSNKKISKDTKNFCALKPMAGFTEVGVMILGFAVLNRDTERCKDRLQGNEVFFVHSLGHAAG